MTNLDAGGSASSHRDIIMIGGSWGSLAPLKSIVRELPAGLPAAVFVVTHISPDYEGQLPKILQQQGHLPAAMAANGEVIRRGRIYVAPPDHHLIIEAGFMRLWRGPKENHSRPSLDPTFRSAAKVYGERVVGVILSGYLDDGTAGLIAIKRICPTRSLIKSPGVSSDCPRTRYASASAC